MPGWLTQTHLQCCGCQGRWPWARARTVGWRRGHTSSTHRGRKEAEFWKRSRNPNSSLISQQTSGRMVSNALKGKGCKSAITTSFSQASTKRTARLQHRWQTPGRHRLQKLQQAGAHRHKHPGRAPPRINMQWRSTATSLFYHPGLGRCWAPSTANNLLTWKRWRELGNWGYK